MQRLIAAHTLSLSLVITQGQQSHFFPKENVKVCAESPRFHVQPCPTISECSAVKPRAMTYMS